MIHYLFSFEGRINRAKLWAFILVGLVFEVIGIVIWAVGMHDVGEGASARIDFSTVPHMVTVAAILLLIVLYFWSVFAVTVKRLHDRDKSAGWLLVFFFLPFVLEVGGVAIGYHMNAGAGIRGINSAVVLPFVAAAMIFLVWGFIELYCLRGSYGENRFGPDPLGGGSVREPFQGNPVA